MTKYEDMERICFEHADKLIVDLEKEKANNEGVLQPKFMRFIYAAIMCNLLLKRNNEESQDYMNKFNQEVIKGKTIEEINKALAPILKKE
jgi:hypothetical protein